MKWTPGMPRLLTSCCSRGVRLRFSHTKRRSEASLAAVSAGFMSVSTVDRRKAASSASSTSPGSAYSDGVRRSEEHTSELQSLMHISYAVFCLKKKKNRNINGRIQRVSTTPNNHPSVSHQTH